MQCHVRTADRTLFDGEATMIVARSPRGEFAIMDEHAPLLAVLQHGPLRVKTADGERVFACLGGTLRVAEKSDVAVLLEEGVPIEEIDLEEVRRALAEIEEQPSTESAPVLHRRRTRLTTLQRVKEQHG